MSHTKSNGLYSIMNKVFQFFFKKEIENFFDKVKYYIIAQNFY